MGSGSNTVTTNQTQTYNPNQPILGMGRQAGQMATTAAQAPFSMPVAPVAGFNPFQQLGFGETLGLQGMAQPYFNTGANYLQQSATPITGADVSQYYNPMAANVTAQMQNIFGQQMRQATGNATQQAGGVGADRIGVAQANLANQQGLAAGQTYSQLYQQALQAAEQQKQMAAGAGYGLGQMGPAAQAAQQNAINQLLGVGGQQQNLTQQQLNAIYQNQLAQIAYPFQTAQYLAGITGGLAPAMGGTTQGQATTTYPSPSPFAQALGIGTAGVGMLGGLFGGQGVFPGALSGGASPFGGGYSPYGSTPYYGSYGGTGGGLGGYYQSGGGVDEYGDLAKRQMMGEYGKTLSAAAQGNPLAEEVEHSLGYQAGGPLDIRPFAARPHESIPLPRPRPFNYGVYDDTPTPRQQFKDLYTGHPDAQTIQRTLDRGWGPNIDPSDADQQNYYESIPELRRLLGADAQHGGKVIDIRPQLEPDDLATALQRSVNLTRGAGASGYQEANPDAIARARRQGVLKIFPSGEQDGGAIQPTLVGDVVRLDPFAGSNESLQEAFDRLENRKTLAASGLRAANPLAVDRAKEHGVLRIFPSPKGLQAGGISDDGQMPMTPAAPMTASGDLPFPGASRPRIGTGSPVPQMQLQPGQGRSGPWGQYMFMHHEPMQQGQQGGAGGLGGSVGQGLQLAKGLGNLGSIFGAGAGAAGAPLDLLGMGSAAGTAGALGVGDIAAGAEAAAPLFLLANRGGGVGYQEGGFTDPFSGADVGQLSAAGAPLANLIPPEIGQNVERMYAGQGPVPGLLGPSTPKDQSQVPIGPIEGDIPLPRPRPTVGMGDPFAPNPVTTTTMPVSQVPSDVIPGDVSAAAADEGADAVGRLPGQTVVGTSGPMSPVEAQIRRGLSGRPGVGGPFRESPSMQAVGPTQPFGLRQGPIPYPAQRQMDWGQRLATSPWMALVRAGAAMASTPGPIGSVIGHGLAAGATELEGQRKSLDSEESINQKAAMLEERAAYHLNEFQRKSEDLQRKREHGEAMVDIAQQRASLAAEKERLGLAGRPPNLQEVAKEVYGDLNWSGKPQDQISAEIQRRYQERLQMHRQETGAQNAGPGQTGVGQEKTFNQGKFRKVRPGADTDQTTWEKVPTS